MKKQLKINPNLSSLGKQKGITAVQIVMGLAVIAVLSALAVRVIVPVFQKSTQNGAFDEFHLIAQSVREVKDNTGSFTALANFTYLTTNGYLDSVSYTNGVNQNVYGNNMTAVRAAGNASATMTYVFDSAPQCLNMVDRLSQIRFVSSVSCTSATLSATIS